MEHVKRTKGAPPSKWPGANDRPSRSAYHGGGVIRMAERKIRRIAANNKISLREALDLWKATRKRRLATMQMGVLEARVSARAASSGKAVR